MCMICGAGEFRSLVIRRQSGKQYTLEGCEKCEVLRLVDPPPKDAEYYLSGQYRKDVPRTEGAIEKARAADRAVVPALLGITCAPTFGYVLDLCAEDNSVAPMFSCRVDTWGLESGPLMAIPESAYDLVTCFLSLEHVEEPIDFARAALRALRPGGLFIASAPNVDKDLGLRPHHTWYYRGNSLMTLLKTAGFQEKASIRYGDYVYVCAML